MLIETASPYPSSEPSTPLGVCYNLIYCCTFSENSDAGLQIKNFASYDTVINCDSYLNFVGRLAVQMQMVLLLSRIVAQGSISLVAGHGLMRMMVGMRIIGAMKLISYLDDNAGHREVSDNVFTNCTF